MTPAYDAVLCDLLTGLLDSWSLWNRVAGDAASGRRWRRRYLELTYRTGAYRPYETLVAEAAEAEGLPRGLAATLAAHYGELAPWPGVTAALARLAHAGIKLGIATNCSNALGRVAAGRTGIAFDCIVTAESAGFYKPDPRPYRLAIDGLGVAPQRCLFLASSAFDLIGAGRLGLATYWHDRIGLAAPPEAPPPRWHERDLDPLPAIVLGEAASRLANDTAI